MPAFRFQRALFPREVDSLLRLTNGSWRFEAYSEILFPHMSKQSISQISPHEYPQSVLHY